jgi:anti-sigma factor RsiW
MATIEISCVEVWREISNYLDGEISADLRERIETHFRACAHCTAVLDGTRNIVALVGDGALFQMQEGFNKRLYEKIRNLPPNTPSD